jgi:ABC-2 type transport system ATP-binding protein
MKLPSASIVEAQAITRCFGSPVAADAVTFPVSAGEVFGLVGPNGAGKTTVIKMLTNFVAAHIGHGAALRYSSPRAGNTCAGSSDVHGFDRGAAIGR